MKQTKLFFTVMAIASMTLVACTDKLDFTQEDFKQQAELNAQQEVQFGTYMGSNGTTRAEVAKSYTAGTIANADGENTTNITKARFGVFSYYTGTDDYAPATPTSLKPNFMYNEQLKYDDSYQWIYSPVKYWPNGNDADNASTPSYTATQSGPGKLSFFAFAPYTETPTTAYNASTDGTKPAQITSDNNVKKNSNTNGINALTTNTFTGNVWVKYLMPSANAASAVDLLWGLAGKSTYDETDAIDPSLTIGQSYNINLTKQRVGEKVKFLFKHALAKVGGSTANGSESISGDPAESGFLVCVDIDANGDVNGGADNQSAYFGTNFTNATTLVTIKEVKIQDGKSISADTNIDWVSGKSNTLNTFGWFNIETGTWCSEAGTFGAGADTETYNVTVNSTDNDVTNTTYTINEKIREAASYGKSGSSSAKVLKSGDEEWTDGTDYPTGVTVTPQPLFANENVPGLLLIPAGGTQTLYITVDYFVRTADKKLDDGFTEVEQKITNSVDLSSLDPNKYYKIIMHLGLTSVKFEAVVTDWAKTDDATFNEDGTITEGSTANKENVWLPSNVVDANAFSASSVTTDFTAAGSASALTVNLNSTALTQGTTASSTNYTATSDQTWATIENGTLTVTANRTNQSRSANITITAKTASEQTLSTVLAINQEADNTYTVTVTDLDKNGANGKIEITGGSSPSTTATQISASGSGTLTLTDLNSITSSNTTTTSEETYTVELSISDTGNTYTYSNITINKVKE